MVQAGHTRRLVRATLYVVAVCPITLLAHDIATDQTQKSDRNAVECHDVMLKQCQEIFYTCTWDEVMCEIDTPVVFVQSLTAKRESYQATEICDSHYQHGSQFPAVASMSLY